MEQKQLLLYFWINWKEITTLKNKQAYGDLLQRKAKIKLMWNLMPLKLFFHLKKIQPEKPDQENVYKQMVYDEYLWI